MGEGIANIEIYRDFIYKLSNHVLVQHYLATAFVRRQQILLLELIYI